MWSDFSELREDDEELLLPELSSRERPRGLSTMQSEQRCKPSSWPRSLSQVARLPELSAAHTSHNSSQTMFIRFLLPSPLGALFEDELEAAPISEA